ncbi:MAG: GNAT family N-acetyltransferase [Sandaracinaceae bacterium]
MPPTVSILDRAQTRAVAGAICLTLLAASGSALAQVAPPEGAWLRYEYRQDLINGRGAYEGWSDVTRGRARYEVSIVEPTRAQLHAQYRWEYRSPDRSDGASIDRRSWFSLPSRLYQGPLTDISDYDSDRHPERLATWAWIPPDVNPGDRVQILEQTFEVDDIAARVEIAGMDRAALHLVSRYTGARDDDYGTFTTTTTDEYWFDSATGMFLRESIDERDVGALNGEHAELTMRTTIEVIDASYASATTPVEDDEAFFREMPVFDAPYDDYDDYDDTGDGDVFGYVVCVLIGLPMILIILFVAGRRFRRRSIAAGDITTADGLRFDTTRHTEVPEAGIAPGLASRYGPFLDHFARVALSGGNRVLVASTADGTRVGLALEDAEAKVGTIFAKDSDVCEVLRKGIGQSEFFSELRHPPLASVKKSGATAPANAYNVYETYEILELTERPADLAYDTDLVRRYRPEDRAKVLALLKAAYGVESERWLDAALANEELAWVADDGGRIVGFAAACLAGADAHLHALTVADDARGRGVGTALMRARVRALFDLGASRIVSECATWNLAAREVASRTGFTKVGEMFVESSDAAREQRGFFRR